MTIYQELWDLDLKNNGCTVSARKSTGEWVDPDADILVDEQVETTKPDLAPDPLFAHVNPDKISGHTYQAFIRLLDNYIVNVSLTEDHLGDNVVEDTEIANFMDVILDTVVMQRTLTYLRDDLGAIADRDDLRMQMMRMWFQLYTNWYNPEKPVSSASGFEHVMVGEGHAKGKGIGGYHSWTKFYLDEKSGRVDFRGFNYDGMADRTSTAGKRFPHVATVSMTWDQKDVHGDVVDTLVKDRGGFFVGPSPELQIALGTIALFQSLAGGHFVKNNENAQTIELNGARYNLIMYRNTVQPPPDNARGDMVRSFYPVFLSPLQSSDTDVVIEPSGEIEVVNDGVIRIMRALPNPEGEDAGNEWVTLENTSNEIISLAGWSLADKLDRRFPLNGPIEPGKSRKFTVTRDTPNSMQMGNKGGLIAVYNAEDAVVARVGYHSVPSGLLLHFVTE